MDHVSDERLEAIGQYGAPITRGEAASVCRELLKLRTAADPDTPDWNAVCRHPPAR